MARLNMVNLIGTVVNKEFDPRMINSEKTDGKNKMAVLNFLIKCYDEKDQRNYTLPVAVWGEDLVTDCLEHVKYGDQVFVSGELRYKFIYNKETKQNEKIYTTVKATTVEFLTKKLKEQRLNYSMNEVKLIGNLVEDPIVSEDGFVIAVDRLYPPKELNIPNHKLTDYVTLVVKDKDSIKGQLKKGSVAIVDGKLMTRKRNEQVVEPRIVVDVREIVGR